MTGVFLLQLALSLVAGYLPKFAAGEWTQWGSWTSCSVTCGEGRHLRVRSCTSPLNDCVGPRGDIKSCNPGDCPTWSDWGSWDDCSTTCNMGTRMRTRNCTGELECTEASTQLQYCQKGRCKEWTPWSRWTRCSRTCGDGRQTRRRSCIGQLGGCDGSSNFEVKACSGDTCPEERNEVWDEWSVCPVTCGGGIQMRSRNCTTNERNCNTVKTQLRKCNGRRCPSWTSWNPWRACSVSCGDGGTQRRYRICPHGVKNVDCMGDAQQSRSCSLDPCPVWNDWEEWGPCALPCMRSRRFRSRECNTTGCDGPTTEMGWCDLPCPQWASWNSWSACSQTCDVGEKTRTRGCYGGWTGHPCTPEGGHTETVSCTDGACGLACPPGYSGLFRDGRKLSDGTFKSSCYTKGNQISNQAAAALGCEGTGASLVSFETRLEYDAFLSNMTSAWTSESFFTSGKYYAGENQWKWLTKDNYMVPVEDGVGVNITASASGECISLTLDAEGSVSYFGQTPCATSMSYICEKDANYIVQS